VGGPNECIEANPSSQTVKLGGKFINLSAISRTQGIDQSYLSRIFARKRDPSLKCARKIAACLGMGLEAFLEALDGKQKEKGRPRG
jgi:DNA-binding phage protein